MNIKLTRETGRSFLIGHGWLESATAVPVLISFAGRIVAEVCQAGKAEADEAMEEMTEPKWPGLDHQYYPVIQKGDLHEI